MNNRLQIAIATALALGSTAVWADGDGVPFGSMTAYPAVGLTVGSDDNLLRTSSNEVDSFVTRLSPGVRVEHDGGATRFQASYEIEAAWYESSGSDDYVDHNLKAQLSHEPTDRSKLDVAAEFESGHDGRGTGSRQGNLAYLDLDPDEYSRWGADGKYRFGGLGAKGAIELAAGFDAKEYDNNRSYTEQFDRDSNFFGGTFFWQIQPKTSLLFEAKQTNVDYDSNSVRDSDETRFMIGATWDATAKTTGTVKVGKLEKDFDDGLVQDFDGESWEVGVAFRPRTYSVIDLSSVRETNESDGFGDYVLYQDFELGWSHEWSNRFNTAVDFTVGSADHKGSARDDDFSGLGVSASYKFRPWLDIGAGYNYFDRDSNDSEYSYTRNLFLISLEAHL